MPHTWIVVNGEPTSFDVINKILKKTQKLIWHTINIKRNIFGYISRVKTIIIIQVANYCLVYNTNIDVAYV